MSSSMIEFLLLAAIAVFIGWRLYVTLGQDNGPPAGRSREPQQPSPAPSGQEEEYGSNVRQLRPTFTGPAAAGMEAIYTADESFDPRQFLSGAKAAYEMIVGAFGRGDRDALKPLLDDDVFEAWDAAISEREANGGEGLQLLRIRKAEISEASLDDEGMARVTVQFEAELGDGEMTSKANELWTFKRLADSPDPNWFLDDVDTVN
ncbi:MAG: Tim44/TimA family putative adaptor protein [Henriciella sp.]|nr:Tim44/TimA family putative adaptor protein [Henriciella sp.]